jgi:hypothetical protein
MITCSELISFYTQKKSREFEVFYETFPAEPDVGFFGNGKQCIEILEVKLRHGNRAKRISPHSSLEENLAHVIYERIG